MGILMSDEMLRMDTSVGSKESIAEYSIVEQVRGVIRIASQAFKEVLSQIKDLSEGKNELVKVRHERIRGFKNSVEGTLITTMEYIVRTAPALVLKDIYVSMIENMLKSVESCEAASYRALALSSRGFSGFDDMLYALIESMVKNSISMVDALDNMLNLLSVNPKKVGDTYIDVVKLEDTIDNFYRHALLELVKSKEYDVGGLVLLKELIDKLEDSADRLKDVATNLKYISLHRI